LNVIEDVSADSAGCGIMGMMGNKGGVAIRFRLHDSYLCLVNSHLAADTKEVERRNQDYQEIQRRITFMQASTPNIGKTISVWDCE
jgi:phosphatidylinositol-bisphosphatase